MRYQKVISLLFLSAITLVLAHTIVPHHHYDESCSINTCHDHQTDGEQSRNSARDPWHCQPYNHLVLVEQQLLKKFKDIVILSYEFTGDQEQQVLSWVKPEIEYPVCPGNLITGCLVLLSTPFRAPPA